MIRAQLSRCVGAGLFALLLSTAVQAGVEPKPTWASLTVAQQRALAPLQRDWPTIEPNRKQKWLELAARFHTLPADERARVQQRMAEWARLTPAERTNARLQFQEARQVPAQERQAKWQAYQALSEDERKTLAQRAKHPARIASAAEASAKAGSNADASGPRRALATTVSPVQPRAVAPIVVQARPGATTSTMSTRVPPPHKIEPGAPRIAATASYVDPATLLPRHGSPQPPAAAPVAASAAAPR